jgi:hypothetical protein
MSVVLRGSQKEQDPEANQAGRPRDPSRQEQGSFAPNKRHRVCMSSRNRTAPTTAGCIAGTDARGSIDQGPVWCH